MTRDLSHEEERKSEWGKLPLEGGGRDGVRMKSREGRKMKRARERLVVVEESITETIIGLMSMLVSNFDIIVKVLDLIQETNRKTF